MTDERISGGNHRTGTYDENMTKVQMNLLEVSREDYQGGLPVSHFIANISAKYTYLSERVRIRINTRYFNNDVKEALKRAGHSNPTAEPYTNGSGSVFHNYDTGYSTYEHRIKELLDKSERNQMTSTEGRELASLQNYEKIVDGVWTISDWYSKSGQMPIAEKNGVIKKSNFAETFRCLVTDNIDILDKWTRYYFDIPKIDTPDFLQVYNTITQQSLDGPFHSGIETEGNPSKQDNWTRWPFSQVTGNYIGDEFIIGNVRDTTPNNDSTPIEFRFEKVTDNALRTHYVGADKIKQGIRAAVAACLCVRNLNVTLKVNQHGEVKTVGSITKHAIMSADPEVRREAVNSNLQLRLRIKKGDVISASKLKDAFEELSDLIEQVTDSPRSATVLNNVTFCHSSCHSNYGARGRR